MLSRATTLLSRRSLSTAAKKNCDIVIVGAGINGMNIAYQLIRRDPSLSIELHEMAPSLGHGSSGYSTGFLRAL
ncbi:hypothetical protein TrRE_jg965, partial [Triparma retinervis]